MASNHGGKFEENDQNESYWMVIIIASASGFLLIIICICCVCIVMKQRKVIEGQSKKRKTTKGVEMMPNEVVSFAHTISSSQEQQPMNTPMGPNKLRVISLSSDVSNGELYSHSTKGNGGENMSIFDEGLYDDDQNESDENGNELYGSVKTPQHETAGNDQITQQ